MPKQPRKPAAGAQRRQISHREVQRYFKVSRAAQLSPPKDEPVPRIDRDEEVEPDDVAEQCGVKPGQPRSG